MKRNTLFIVGLVGLVLIAGAAIALPNIFKAPPAAPTAIVTPTATQVQYLTLNCVVGSEKQPFFTDPEVVKALADNFQLTVNITTAGSNAMVGDQTGPYSTASLKSNNIDCLSPSNNAAVAVFEAMHNKGDFPGYQTKDIFYSPMIMLCAKDACDAEMKAGVVVLRDNFFYIADTTKMTEQVLNGVAWTDLDPAIQNIGGKVKVKSTDPGSSNSAGLLYIGIFGNSLAGDPYTPYGNDALPTILPKLHQIRVNTGQKAKTSEDFFNAWISGADGSPLGWFYESQVLEWTNQASPNELAALGRDFNVLYPEPDIKSIHEIICLDAQCARLIEALQSPIIQELAWKHGFRTLVSGVNNDPAMFPHLKVPTSLKTTDLPEADVYLKTVLCLADKGPCQ